MNFPVCVVVRTGPFIGRLSSAGEGRVTVATGLILSCQIKEDEHLPTSDIGNVCLFLGNPPLSLPFHTLKKNEYILIYLFCVADACAILPRMCHAMQVGAGGQLARVGSPLLPWRSRVLLLGFLQF